MERELALGNEGVLLVGRCGLRWSSAVAGMFAIVLTAWMTVGCGGSGTPVAPPDDGGGEVAATETATAHFAVDVETGEVTVTHLETSGDAVDSAAAFTGTAVGFDRSVLYDQPAARG